MIKKVYLIICLAIFSNIAFAQSTTSKPDEKKIDYLEKIYFSGGTKDSLYVSILKTVQKLDNKPATYAVAKQFIFLNGIADAAQNADNACDVESMLAKGMYVIDADEASAQGVPVPNNKSASDAANAVQSLDAFGNSTQGLAYNSWELSRNHISPYGYYYDYGYSPAQSRMMQTGYQLSAVANTAGTGIAMVQEGKQVAKFLHLNKDKPCKTVPVKPIEIGEHEVPDTNNTTIVINNITTDQVSNLAATISRIAGINSVNSDNFENNIATLFIGAPNMKTQDLVSKIIQTNRNMKFDIINRSAKGATLAVK